MTDAEKIEALKANQKVIDEFVKETIDSLLPLHDRKWAEKLGLTPGDKLNVHGVKALISYAEKLELELALKSQ